MRNGQRRDPDHRRHARPGLPRSARRGPCPAGAVRPCRLDLRNGPTVTTGVCGGSMRPAVGVSVPSAAAGPTWRAGMKAWPARSTTSPRARRPAGRPGDRRRAGRACRGAASGPLCRSRGADLPRRHLPVHRPVTQSLNGPDPPQPRGDAVPVRPVCRDPLPLAGRMSGVRAQPGDRGARMNRRARPAPSRTPSVLSSRSSVSKCR